MFFNRMVDKKCRNLPAHHDHYFISHISSAETLRRHFYHIRRISATPLIMPQHQYRVCSHTRGLGLGRALKLAAVVGTAQLRFNGANPWRSHHINFCGNPCKEFIWPFLDFRTADLKSAASRLTPGISILINGTQKASRYRCGNGQGFGAESASINRHVNPALESDNEETFWPSPQTLNCWHIHYEILVCSQLNRVVCTK